MNVQELIRELEKNKPILPKEILNSSSERELVSLIINIYESHPEKLKEKVFQENFLYLVTYLYKLHLSRKTKQTKEPIFSSALIESLISLPEPA